jgi:hypothetical protein
MVGILGSVAIIAATKGDFGCCSGPECFGPCFGPGALIGLGVGSTAGISAAYGFAKTEACRAFKERQRAACTGGNRDACAAELEDKVMPARTNGSMPIPPQY